MKQNFENGESTEGGMVCLGRNICRFRFYLSTGSLVQKEALRKIWWAVRDSNAGPMD